MEMTPIARAVDQVGRQKLADALGVSPSMISQWVTGHRPIAARHVLPIEAATGGQVTRYELAPEVFGPPPKSEAA